MFSKRKLAVACVTVSLGASLLATSQKEGDLRRWLTARHVKEATFVSAGNRQLAGFFDGMVPDPRWDAAKALQVGHTARRCGSNAVGLFGRLTALFERTVHAQSGCVQLPCSDCYVGRVSGDCPGCSQFYYTDYTDSQCTGGRQLATVGCSGTAPGCSPACNSGTCDNSFACQCDGSCIKVNKLCSNFGDPCCSGLTCNGLICQNIL
jgi:hypothetical protein